MAAATGQPQDWIETSGTGPPSPAPTPARRRLLQAGNGRVLVLNKVRRVAGRQVSSQLHCSWWIRQAQTEHNALESCPPGTHASSVVLRCAALPQVHGYEEQLQGVITNFNASLADGSFQTQLLAYQLRLVPNTGEVPAGDGWAAALRMQ